MSFDVAPPQPVNTLPVQGPQPVAGQAAGNPVSLNFTAAPAGANDPDFLSAQDVWNKAVADETTASAQAGQLYNDFTAAQQAAATDLTGSGNARVTATGQAYETALRALANATTAKENAATKMHDADTAAASRAKDPDLKAYYQAHAGQASAAAALSAAQASALAAKTPEDIKNLQAQTTEATARATALGILTPAQAAQANQQANLYGAQAQQINTLLPFLGREEAAKATITEAQAGVAPQAAQAALAKTQADVDQAKATVDETRRRISGMPTEEQAQAAIDLGLKDKQADLDAKQAQLEQARKLMPLAVGQATANVAATEAGTAATLAGIGQKTLGPLYGIGDQISRYRDMIASGQINPQDADTALNTYLNTQVTGATPFQAAQEQNRVAQERLTTAEQFAGNTLGTFNQLAAGAGPGHGAELAAGYQAALNMGQQFFGQMGGFGPSGNPMQSVQSQMPQVHINIGTGPPTSAPQPSGVAAAAPAAPVAAPALPPAPPPLPDVGAAPPVAATTPDWFGALQQRQAASGQEQQAQGDAWQAHLDNWKDELDSGAVTLPGEQQQEAA